MANQDAPAPVVASFLSVIGWIVTVISGLCLALTLGFAADLATWTRPSFGIGAGLLFVAAGAVIEKLNSIEHLLKEAAARDAGENTSGTAA
jgi:hypothetical protein